MFGWLDAERVTALFILSKTAGGGRTHSRAGQSASFAVKVSERNFRKESSETEFSRRKFRCGRVP
ncbi:MAG: hypothetical protein BHW56_03020 [Acetobacter sp. 46_36]|nr:MAG: hypothetical protein BHW56_03020 [Acetobacter sp. 46_36]